jgi:ATP-dependent Clp protease, protease subunit
VSKFWSFKNVGTENKTPELLVYGEISEWWGVDSKSFAEQLQQINADEINVRINSYGGEVFTASAIYSMLKRHKATINVFVDGIAASAASVIAMAGDKITMPENAMIMIHNPLTGMVGNANELRETADLLDKVRDTLVATYKAKTGLDDATIVNLLDEETYLNAQEALEYGFIDDIENEVQIAASLTREKMIVNGMELDPAKFANMPDKWLNKSKAQEKPVSKPAGSACNKQPKEIKTMNLETLKADHPDLYKQVLAAGEAEGVKAERARIKDIEDTALPGHDKMTNAAKFESGITAAEYAMQVIKAEKEKGTNFLASRKKDAEKLDDVDQEEPEFNPENSADDEKRKKARAAAAKVGASNRKASFLK